IAAIHGITIPGGSRFEARCSPPEGNARLPYAQSQGENLSTILGEGGELFLVPSDFLRLCFG
ncbi:MAG: hypothetical protein R6X07_06585, partial [Desulfatiglandales bacterium]